MSSIASLMSLLVTGIGVLIGLLLLYLIVKSRYKKAGPDEALIVYGRRKLFGKKLVDAEGEATGFRIVRGSGTFRAVAGSPSSKKVALISSK